MTFAQCAGGSLRSVDKRPGCDKREPVADKSSLVLNVGMTSAAHKLACLLTIAVCAATAAFAQDEAPSALSPAPIEEAFEPAFERRPDAGPPQRIIPTEATRRNQAGAVIICCRPRADRTLDCETGWEAPTGLGFGRAATRFVASQQQLTESSYEDYLARSDQRAFPQPMRFQFTGAAASPPLPPREERQALCDAAMPVEN
jgi:hypothetical protein